MKKKLPIILLGVILACVLVFGFLYANNDIGKTANSLEADIRQSQKILDDWIVDGSISDTMAAFISYPQDKTDHTFSVYVNRPGLSFGYFFRGGGDIVEVDDYIAEFVVEGNNERAFISMNTQNIVRLEVDDGNGIQVIDIDSGKPFAIVLPLNVGNICFYDILRWAAFRAKPLTVSFLNARTPEKCSSALTATPQEAKPVPDWHSPFPARSPSFALSRQGKTGTMFSVSKGTFPAANS